MREETWEDAAQVCRYYLKYQNFEGEWDAAKQKFVESEFAQAVAITCENIEKIMLEKATLKLEPNAAAEPDFQMGDPHPCDMTPAEREKLFAAGPAPAAPDVAEMIDRLLQPHAITDAYPSLREFHREVAALLSRLGQGWVPVSADNPTRQVAWIDNDARHVGIFVGSHRYLLTLPPPPERP